MVRACVVVEIDCVVCAQDALKTRNQALVEGGAASVRLETETYRLLA
jgi:hypothetical protein